jgi:hypothetical protein
MAIKTHADLRKAIEEVETLFHRFHWQQEGARWHIRTTTQKSKADAAWRALCRSLDRVVHAAGGHRDGCTWHLFGSKIHAKSLYEDLFTNGSHTVRDFIHSKTRRSAHNQMKYAALMNGKGLLPDPRSNKGLDLPAPGGRELQAEAERVRKAWADWENQDNPSVIDDDDGIPF